MDRVKDALKRVLGPGQLIMLGVGAIIGTGIFVLTGQAAAANAGPAIVISMVLAGLTSVLAALCYSEFAASVPVAGSAYTYAYATLGEFIAWVIGWDLILRVRAWRGDRRGRMVRQLRDPDAPTGHLLPGGNQRRAGDRHSTGQRGDRHRGVQSPGCHHHDRASPCC